MSNKYILDDEILSFTSYNKVLNLYKDCYFLCTFNEVNGW